MPFETKEMQEDSDSSPKEEREKNGESHLVLLSKPQWDVDAAAALMLLRH